ncbi:hypothetical protein QBC43DRAFT_321784 [Cladorrhinum sp. PSN259]|nr:hypothetical protein QBC43DRAFT_321784 [Cladorrhinum sp. PSN259]
MRTSRIKSRAPSSTQSLFSYLLRSFGFVCTEMELAGVVLGAIPIAIHIYDRVAPRISAYRNYRKRVDHSIVKLVAQHTIFEMRGNGLIFALDKHQAALDSWLPHEAGLSGLGTDGCHHTRPGMITPIRLRKQIEHCNNLAISIKDCLDTIGTKLGRFTDDPDATHMTKLGKKTAYALLRMDEDFLSVVRELVSLNQDFSTIAAEVIKTLDEIFSPGSSAEAPKKKNAADINTVEKYRQIRSASTELYDTLAKRWICRNHQSHVVSVSFVDGHQQRETVRFDIAISACEGTTPSISSVSSQSAAPAPLWLEIEHSNTFGILDNSSRTDQKVTFTPALMNSLDAAINRRIDEGSGTARHQLETASRKDSSPSLDTLQRRVERDLTVSVSDFCDHFMEQYQINPSRRECLGFLRRQQQFLQRCYLPPLDRRYTGNTLPMDALISWVRRRATGGSLGTLLITKLSKSLATSVLYFHTTPWLCDKWNSSDLRFFDRGGFLDSELNPSPPHLQVALNMSNPRVREMGLTPNTKLFLQFGKALIELGFSSSWQSLHQEISRDLGLSDDPDRNTTHYIAIQLCKRLKRQIGDRYVRVIENCIDADLKNLYPDHDDQILFFSEVVGVMQDLNERWQRFQQSLG